MTYRIFETDDTGRRSVAGWGDHATMASAMRAVSQWGRVTGWKMDREHDAADTMLIPGDGLDPTWISIERMHERSDCVTN